MQLSTFTLTGLQRPECKAEASRMRHDAVLNQRSLTPTRFAPHVRSRCLRQVTIGHLHLVEECTTSNWNRPLAAAAGVSGPVFIALGKFDGMHQGHRLLAQQAASSDGSPFLLSFSGMAEVLGWPARLPLVAASDRARVLASWASHCQGRTPRQRYIPFAMVRNLSPEAFVQTLVKDLKVSGIVVGDNYRFGYKAAGDSKLLQALGEAHGIHVNIVNLVEAGAGGVNGQISSSKIRAALNQGQMQQIAESLGRPYRLVADISSELVRLDPDDGLRIPIKCMQNQPPMYNQTYQVTVLVTEKSAVDGAALSTSRQGNMFMSEQGVMLCKDLSMWLQQMAAGRHCMVSLDFQ